MLVVGEQLVLEREIQSCAHCGTLWVTGMEYNHVRGFCRKCMRPTCGVTGCFECIPYERELEIIEAAYRAGLPEPVRCGHCRTFYQPVPGSGKVRGWCLLHNGPLCGECPDVDCRGR